MILGKMARGRLVCTRRRVSRGFSNLGNRIMFENFHKSGKYDSRSIALNIQVKSIIAL